MGSFAPLNNAGQQGGSAMSGTGQQQTPMQGGGIGGMGLGGMPAPMQNPFLGGQPQGMMPPPPIPPAPQGPGAGPTSQPQTMQERLARASELLGTRGGGMGQPYITDRGYFGPGTMSSVNTTTTQDIMGRGSSGVPFPQGPGAGVTPEMLSRLLQGTPSDANGPYPAQVRALPFQTQQLSLQQQRMMDRLNQQFGRQMQPYQQQMQQLQQQYMGQPPQELQQMQQQLQQMPEFQAIDNAFKSGNIQEANRLQQAFEATPQFQQMRQAGDTFNLQQQQAQQKMMADPRFNQLQNRMQELERRKQRLIQARQPQPAQGLGTGIGSLLGRFGGL